MSGSFENWSNARKVCVIGAGTMGGGISAHLANLGFEVALLDVTRESVTAGMERLRSAKPPHLYIPENAERILPGVIESSLDAVRSADWVCEAIVEKVDAKRALFEMIEPLLREDAMISTNTSGLEIARLAEGRSESFRRRFMGTHFFNPPRYLKLLELVPTADTDRKAVQSMARFLEECVARRVVVAKDTPGFIANRYGMWCMFHAVHVAEKLQLTPEQVDAITGPFIGRPRTGSFRLNDLVGLDIMADIAANLRQRCTHDARRTVLELPRTMKVLLERGWIGDKVGRGYYRREGPESFTFDFSTLAYRMRLDANLPSLAELEKLPLDERLRRALDLRDEVGEFLRAYLIPALQYANEIKEEISHSVLDFDRVMKWGFGWELGPFELMDSVGHERLGIEKGSFYKPGKMLAFSGRYVPIRKEPQYSALEDFPTLEKLDDLTVRDLGDGVVAFCFTTKMGIVTPRLVYGLAELLDSGKHERIVLASEAKTFSAGFDLKFFADRIEAEDWEAIEVALASLQEVTVKLGKVSSVAAVFGNALGAGLELALGCGRIVAAVESRIGFPEARVGLIPGGGGTARTRIEAQSAGVHAVANVALLLTQGYVASNAVEAQAIGYLRDGDRVTYLQDRLIWDAKQAALTVGPAPDPEWRLFEGPIAGMIDRGQQELIAKGELTAHDELIGDRIKAIVAKSTSFEDALARERQAFVDLCKTGLSLARIRHMLETGKPLRN